MAAAPAIVRQLAFRVGDQRFALPINAVREVVRRPALTQVPHAPDSLIGLANLRGTVLPVVSLAALVGEATTEAGSVIVLAQADPLGILVDTVSSLSDGIDGHLLDVSALLGETFGTARPVDRSARISVITASSRAIESDRVVLLGFLVGGQEFSLPLDQVEEVIRLPREITLLPHADAVVVGTIARQGRLLPLLALDRLLGLKRAHEDQRQRVVVARIGAQKVGLVVDTVSAILRVDPRDVDAIPAALARGGGEASIQAICRLEGGRRLVSILAANQLLRTDLHLAQPSEDEVMTCDDGEDAEQFLIFRLGDQEFGLPIAVVSEVTALPETLTRLPRALAFVEGVMNLRGQIVPVIDQRRRFLGEATTSKRRRVIVVTLDDTLAGFVVDTVSEVVRLPATALRPAPELGGEGTRVFDRIATPDGRMILIVAPRELLDRAERDLLAGVGAPSIS